MNEGKLSRTERVIAKANRLCPATSRETWAAEVEVAAALGRYTDASRLVATINAAKGAPAAATLAAKTADTRIKRFNRLWPAPDKVTPAMRSAHADAERAEAQGRLDEAIALYEKAWEAWPLNGTALLTAGLLAKKQGRMAEAQRFFDRGAAVMEGRTLAKTRAEVPNGFTGPVTSVAWSPSGMRLAAAHGNAISIDDTNTWQERVRLEAHDDRVTSVAFSPDGKQVASASDDTTVRIWDAVTGAPLLTLQGHTNSVNSVAFSPDGRRIASGSDDTTVRLWDTATGAPLLTLQGHTDLVNAVAFSPDGKHIASGSNDHTVRLWNAATGAPLRALQGHTGWVNAVAFSPDGKHIASGSWDDTVRLWDAATGAPLRALQGHTDLVNALAFSPDGKRIAFGVPR